MAMGSEADPRPGPALPTAAALWPEPGAPPLASKPPLGSVRRLLRLEWGSTLPTRHGPGVCATMGDYRVWVTPHAGYGLPAWMWEIATLHMEGDKTCEIGFADTELAAQLAAEAALMARLEVYRPMLEVNDGR